MATALPVAAIGDTRPQASARAFALAAGTVMLASCALAGLAPLGFSIVTVFLFAGPHNWMEARYLLARMPGRWGRMRGYYTTGLVGVLSLTSAFALLPQIAVYFDLGETAWPILLSLWNTALVLWVLLLTQLRARQNPRREWGYLIPLALVTIAAAWLWPQPWDLALVYLHPLVAIWFLDRELAARKPHWHAAGRRVLCLLPVLLVVLWCITARSPSLAGPDALTVRITRHAGSDIVGGVSSHLLVATHTFLEMIHYGVWLVAIPLVGLKAPAWKVTQAPLARQGEFWRRFVIGLMVAGALFVLAFWAGFLANYPLTRDVYFTVAMLHVLAEVPFLLRLL